MTFGKRHEHVFLGREMGHERDYGEGVATIIDEEVKSFVDTQYQRVKQLLTEYRPHMDEIVKVLLEKETIDAKDVDAIIKEVDRRLGRSITATNSGSGDDDGNPTATDGETVIKTDALESGGDQNQGPDQKPEFKPKFA